MSTPFCKARAAKVNAHIERTGEATSAFISRALSDTIARDEALLKMGISPARKEKSKL